MEAGTIYALSSAPGKAGVAVVRVSGPEALSSLKLIANVLTPPRPREAVTKILRHPVTGERIDHALILFFKGPASFTGEDVVEYHVHGSVAVLDALFAALASCPKHRMAEPGEFTRRAFENGKLDLTEAEAVADLIAAQTAMQRQQALAQLGGALARLYDGWREKLVRAMAYVEAVIDFPDEDVPDSETAKVRPDIEALIAAVEAHLADGHRGERLREGISIVILGAPNAGKSSLLNALARREVAIVSPMAGTTRDVLEVHLDLGGYPVSVADTAGLRSVALEDDGGHGGIEAEGIRRALLRAEEADIRLLLFDGCDPVLNAQTLVQLSDSALCVLTKADDPGFCHGAPPPALAGFPKGRVISLSAKTGKNMDVLLRVLTQEIAGRFDTVRDTPTLTRARHRDALDDALRRLRFARDAALPELMAEDLRMAARAIGRITGRVDVEDLLDVIFRDFCIGK